MARETSSEKQPNGDTQKRDERREMSPAESGTWPFFGMPFGRLFDEFWSHAPRLSSEPWFQPSLDVSEDEHSYVVELELPGLRKEDVRIQIEDGTLCVSGERKFEAGNRRANRLERRYGAFCRTLDLPAGANVDAANAEMKDGVLTITVPKREEAKPKTLAIR